MPQQVMSDAEVFGDTSKVMSDEEVFGTAKAAAPRVSVVKDMAKGGATGLGQGIVAPAGIKGDAANLLNAGAHGAGWLLTKAGAPNAGAAVGQLADFLHQMPGSYGGVINPFSGLSSGDVNQNLGLTYEAKTVPGKILQKGGQFAPAALSPGSAGARIAAVAAPAVGSVVGREGVKAAGGGEGAQAVGEFVGGIGGGLATAARVPKIAPKVKPVSLDELRTAKDAAYAAVDAAGVSYKPTAVDGLVADAKARLGDDFDPDLHKSVTSALKKLDGMSGKPATMKQVEQARRFISRNVLVPQNTPEERRLGYMLRDSIDEFVAATGPKSVQGGTNPEAAAQSVAQARDLNTRLSKAESIQEAGDRAQSRAARTGSGGNINNATRSEVGKVMDRRRDWTPDEKAALTNLVEGGKVDNVLRQAGKLAPQGNGLGLWMNLGAAAKTGGLSLPVTAGAAIAKGLADKATTGKIEKLVQQIANGGQGSKAAQAQLQLLAQSNPKVPLIASDTAKRMLAIGGLSIAAGAPAMPVAAQRQQSRR